MPGDDGNPAGPESGPQPYRPEQGQVNLFTRHSSPAAIRDGVRYRPAEFADGDGGADKHVVCEKPMSADAAEAQQVTEAVTFGPEPSARRPLRRSPRRTGMLRRCP
jgi:hypothetical protein